MNEIASYFESKRVDTLQTQKLLYFAQGSFYDITNNELFDANDKDHNIPHDLQPPIKEFLDLVLEYFLHHSEPVGQESKNMQDLIDYLTDNLKKNREAKLEKHAKNLERLPASLFQ